MIFTSLTCFIKKGCAPDHPEFILKDHKGIYMAVDYLSALNSKGSGLNITQLVDSLVKAETEPKKNCEVPLSHCPKTSFLHKQELSRKQNSAPQENIKK